MDKNIDQCFSTGKTIIQALSYFSFLLAAFSLSFPSHYLNLFLFVWMILNSLDVVTRGKYHFELPNKNNIHLYFLFLFYIWMVISLLWTNNMEEGQKLLIRRISFLLFPVFSFFGFNRFYRIKHVLLVFISGALLSVMVTVILSWQQAEFFEQFATIEQFYERIVSMYKHRTYLSLCLIFSLVFYMYLKKYLIRKSSPLLYYAVFLVLSVLFFFVIYLSQSRMSLIIFLVISSYILFTILREEKFKKMIFPILSAFLIFSAVLLENQSRMQHLELVHDKLQRFDPRYELWRNTIECIQESNIIIGVGVGDCEDVFDKNHQKPEFQEYYYPASNPHNEFLKTQLELGLIGSLLLLCILLTIVINSKKREIKFFSISASLIWVLFMLIETTGITSTSTYLLSFSLVLIYMVKKREEKQT